MSHSTGNVLALGLAIFATLTCHSVYGFGFGFGGGGGGHFDEMMHHGGMHQYEHSFHPVHMFKKFKMKKAVPIPVIIKPIIVDRKVPVKVGWLLFNCFQIVYLKLKLNEIPLFLGARSSAAHNSRAISGDSEGKGSRTCAG